VLSVWAGLTVSVPGEPPHADKVIANAKGTIHRFIVMSLHAHVLPDVSKNTPFCSMMDIFFLAK
jgi:hypothetical protein